MPRERLVNELPDYARELLLEVVESTESPFIIREKDAPIKYSASLLIAAEPESEHVLVYSPEYREHRVHLILNAALKVKRVWGCPPEERLAPVMRAEANLDPDDEKDLRSKLVDDAPEVIVQGLSRFLHGGLLEELTNIPMDIRVEREMVDLFPAHVPLQQAYLRGQLGELRAMSEPPVEWFSPPKIYAASTAMNLVLAEDMATMIDVELPRWCVASPHRELGYTLWETLDEVEVPGHRGDRLAIDRWADVLGLRGDYSWKRLDEAR